MYLNPLSFTCGTNKTWCGRDWEKNGQWVLRFNILSTAQGHLKMKMMGAEVGQNSSAMMHLDYVNWIPLPRINLSKAVSTMSVSALASSLT